MSVSSILSRPLNIQDCFLGSEMNVLRLFQEGNTGDIENLLKRGLNPNSKFTHPKYANLSLLSFVVLSISLPLTKRLELIELLLEHGASEISSVAVNMMMFLLTPSHLEIAAHLLFLLPHSLWQQSIEKCKDESLKQKLSSVLVFRGLFEVLQKKYFCVFRAALKVSCLKKLDIFSLKPFNINDCMEERSHTLLHFSSYHLSVASSEKHETQAELEKVVLTLLNLGADALQLTEEDAELASSTSSSRKRKASSLSLLNMGFKKQSKGNLSPEIQVEAWKSSISTLLQKHPLSRQTREPYSKEKADKVAKTAALHFISFRK